MGKLSQREIDFLQNRDFNAPGSGRLKKKHKDIYKKKGNQNKEKNEE